MAITVEPLGSKGTYAADTAISSAYPAAWAVGDTAIVCFSGDAQATGALVVDAGASAADLTLAKDAEASNAGNVAVSIWSGTVLTAAGEEFALAGESPSYGNTIWAIWGDDTYVYCGGYTTNTIRKYRRSDLSYIGQTASYGGLIYAIWGDDTHVYCGGYVTDYPISKYLKSDLSYVNATVSYGGGILGIWSDDTHVYGVGVTTRTIRKYLKSDMSYIGETANYGGTIRAIWGDDIHVYCGGLTTNTIRKYIKIDNGSASGSGVITVSYSSMTAKAIAYYRATGLAASPFDKSATATGSGDAPSSGATDTLTQADELGIGVIGMEEEDDEAGTWTTGAGNVSGNALIACANGGGAKSSTVMAVAEVLSATTAQTAAQTATGSNDWAAAVATYLMAAAAAGFPHSFGMIIT